MELHIISMIGCRTTERARTGDGSAVDPESLRFFSQLLSRPRPLKFESWGRFTPQFDGKAEEAASTSPTTKSKPILALEYVLQHATQGSPEEALKSLEHFALKVPAWGPWGGGHDLSKLLWTTLHFAPRIAMAVLVRPWLVLQTSGSLGAVALAATAEESARGKEGASAGGEAAAPPLSLLDGGRSWRLAVSDCLRRCRARCSHPWQGTAARQQRLCLTSARSRPPIATRCSCCWDFVSSQVAGAQEWLGHSFAVRPDVDMNRLGHEHAGCPLRNDRNRSTGISAMSCSVCEGGVGGCGGLVAAGEPCRAGRGGVSGTWRVPLTWARGGRGRGWGVRGPVAGGHAWYGCGAGGRQQRWKGGVGARDGMASPGRGGLHWCGFWWCARGVGGSVGFRRARARVARVWERRMMEMWQLESRGALAPLLAVVCPTPRGSECSGARNDFCGRWSRSRLHCYVKRGANPRGHEGLCGPQWHRGMDRVAVGARRAQLLGKKQLELTKKESSSETDSAADDCLSVNACSQQGGRYKRDNV
eukprot:s1936_g13.t1